MNPALTGVLQALPDLSPRGSAVQAIARTAGVGVRMQGRPVLTGIDLEVCQGTLTTVLGPNGAGKTTLLRVLATLVRPDEGTVELFGRPASRADIPVRARIGYVGHQPMLYRELTVLENLELFGRLYRLDDARRRALDVLREVSLLDRAAEPVKSLSRGLCQRAAVARALMHDPQLLLADEPFAGLDAASSERVEACLLDLVGRGKTVVVASHDRDWALRMTGQILVLRDGRCVLDGPAETLDSCMIAGAMEHEL